jgi:two-component system nitrogen regulation sensor histidine kinase NtrY
MRLSFHQRILLILICLGALPTAAAILGWGLTIRSTTPAGGTRAAIAEVGASGRLLLQTIDSTRLSPAERRALATHAERLNSTLARVQQLEAYGRYYYAGLGLAIFFVGAAFLYTSIRLGGHLSRQLSRPIDELIGWTGHIRRMEPLPADQPRRGAPEFEALRTALREMAAALERGRAQELEAERLRAFRETARRVAHEMRNPLTPIRLAVAQLVRSVPPGGQAAVEVLSAESDRLEQLARAFTDFGRMPEGPAAAVDLNELLAELARSSLPDGIAPTLELAPDLPEIRGHYDPLRRAFSNILRNAVEACDGAGLIEISTRRESADWVRVEVRDHGPGVPAELRDRIFEPYWTGKEHGTGLGLALVKQTVEIHRGTIDVTDTPGGGATFVVRLRGV